MSAEPVRAEDPSAVPVGGKGDDPSVTANAEEPHRGTGPPGEWRPIPDPTKLTTEQLRREVATLREILETRLDGMDRATERDVRADQVAETAPQAELLSGRGLGQDARRAIEAIAALQIVDKPLQARELFSLLRAGGGGAEVVPPDVVADNMVVADNTVAQIKHAGAARKVSVSMPENLTTAVQQRVGRGKFSQYVTEAVARQLELDLLAELSELLTSEHGPVPEEYLKEAWAAWPDGE